MKFWYHPKFKMYVPKNPWWENSKWNDELVEVDVDKEELIVEGGDDDPYCHSERWEITWSEKDYEHSIMNKIPWPLGKYRITIEPLEGK